ncbi:MAG: hypothetical protein BGO69_07945 [Bacteroidetes bacterium 46-16]|nr:MAG: hypothetical protein BGO69_07945 [Bacteroidetes bacterium 46-16]
MKKFIVLYHAPMDAMQQTADATPEQQAEGMKAWMDWAQKVGDKMVDLGAPLMNGRQVRPDGSSSDSDKNVVGYSVLQAGNMEEAKKLLEGHPHLSGWNDACTIEVHETMPIPGM